MAPSKPLSERERRFVDALTGRCAGNATQAATVAGYSPKSARRIGTRLSSRVHIQAAVRARRDVLSNRSIADATERREILTSLARNTFAEETISRIRAIDVLNRMDCLYIQKHQHAGADGGPIRLAPDEDLDARIAELERQVKR